MVEISTSILSLEEEGFIQKVYDLEVAGTDYFHIDVMDGKFVENNNLAIMLEYATTIKHVSNIGLDVHFMVENPREYIEEYIPLNPRMITFHYEACNSKEEVYELIKIIKENNIKVGITIKPDTKVEDIYEFVPYIHMILVMTVVPGKGGQELIKETLKKVKNLKKYCEENNFDIEIEADGGINETNIKQVVESGIDIAVVGTGLLKQEDYKKAIKELKVYN